MAWVIETKDPALVNTLTGSLASFPSLQDLLFPTVDMVNDVWRCPEAIPTLRRLVLQICFLTGNYALQVLKLDSFKAWHPKYTDDHALTKHLVFPTVQTMVYFHSKLHCLCFPSLCEPPKILPFRKFEVNESNLQVLGVNKTIYATKLALFVFFTLVS